MYPQMEKEKRLLLRVKENLKIEIIDLKDLPLKSIIKKEDNFKFF